MLNFQSRDGRIPGLTRQGTRLKPLPGTDAENPAPPATTVFVVFWLFPLLFSSCLALNMLPSRHCEARSNLGGADAYEKTSTRRGGPTLPSLRRTCARAKEPFHLMIFNKWRGWTQFKKTSSRPGWSFTTTNIRQFHDLMKRTVPLLM